MPLDALAERARSALLDRFERRDDGALGELMQAPARNQLLVQVRREEVLRALAEHLALEGFHLVTVVANDERELEDRCFKLYYLLSHPEADLFLLVEYVLARNEETYLSLFPWFEAVDCFEREIRDVLGLRARREDGVEVGSGSWLHECYRARLEPLRRDRTIEDLARDAPAGAGNSQAGGAPAAVPRGEGSLLLPVGPVHAGIIEPGRFLFTIAGEVVEDLDIRLGYAHKGIERLFQSRLRLLDGWRLAEQVSGDSSFAHALAYCRAAETLTGVDVPAGAELLRVLFLELERIHNHVGDVAALAHDVALERLASDLAVIREQLLRLNKLVAGHRYLRRLNRPGGVALPEPLDSGRVRQALGDSLPRFDALARGMGARAEFRDRTIGIGVLTPDEARRLGVTGLAARACGVPRDYRWHHPTGGYCAAWLRDDRSPRVVQPDEPRDGDEAQRGDVYARFLTRVREVGRAHAIVRGVLDRWDALPERRRQREALLREPSVLPENNYTFAIGYAEGFRGDVVYWLMQDKLNGIYRCKVRDPSMLNWRGLRQSVLPRTIDGRWAETLLPDFPLVNKSFNLSYSGNDL